MSFKTVNQRLQELALVIGALIFFTHSISFAASPDRVVSIAATSIFPTSNISSREELKVEILYSPFPHQRAKEMKSLFVYSSTMRQGKLFSFYGEEQLTIDLSSEFEADISDVELVDYNQDGSPDLLLSSASSGQNLNGKIVLWQYGLAYNANTGRLDQDHPISVVRTGGTNERIGAKMLALPSINRSGVLVQHPTLNAVYFMSQTPGLEWLPFAVQDRQRHPGFASSMGLISKDALCGPSGRDFVAFLSGDGTIFTYDPYYWRLISSFPLLSRNVAGRISGLSKQGADLIADPDGRCADFVVADTRPSPGGGTQVAVALSHGRLEANAGFVTTDPSSLQHHTAQVETLRLFGDDRRWQDAGQGIYSGTPLLLVRNQEKVLYFASTTRRTNSDIESMSITCDGSCGHMSTGELNGDSWEELVLVEGTGAEASVNVYSHGGAYLLSNTSTTTARDGSHFGSLYLGAVNMLDGTGMTLKIFGPALDQGNAQAVILQFSQEIQPANGIDLGFPNDHRLRPFASDASKLLASVTLPVSLNPTNGARQASISFELAERLLFGDQRGNGAFRPAMAGITAQALVLNNNSSGELVLALSQGYRLTTVPYIAPLP